MTIPCASVCQTRYFAGEFNPEKGLQLADLAADKRLTRRVTNGRSHNGTRLRHIQKTFQPLERNCPHRKQFLKHDCIVRSEGDGTQCLCAEPEWWEQRRIFYDTQKTSSGLQAAAVWSIKLPTSGIPVAAQAGAGCQPGTGDPTVACLAKAGRCAGGDTRTKSLHGPSITATPDSSGEAVFLWRRFLVQP